MIIMTAILNYLRRILYVIGSVIIGILGLMALGYIPYMVKWLMGY